MRLHDMCIILGTEQEMKDIVERFEDGTWNPFQADGSLEKEVDLGKEDAKMALVTEERAAEKETKGKEADDEVEGMEVDDEAAGTQRKTSNGSATAKRKRSRVRKTNDEGTAKKKKKEEGKCNKLPLDL